MAILTFTKTAKQITNPFDDTIDDVLEVVPSIDGAVVAGYTVQFPSSTPDATIQVFLTTDLQSKGYAV